MFAPRAINVRIDANRTSFVTHQRSSRASTFQFALDAFQTFVNIFIENVLHWLPVDPTAVTEAITTNQIERILFGVLIIVFLILEPLGLYGIWIRVRNYWKAFPFSY